MESIFRKIIPVLKVNQKVFSWRIVKMSTIRVQWLFIPSIEIKDFLKSIRQGMDIPFLKNEGTKDYL